MLFKKSAYAFAIAFTFLPAMSFAQNVINPSFSSSTQTTDKTSKPKATHNVAPGVPQFTHPSQKQHTPSYPGYHSAPSYPSYPGSTSSTTKTPSTGASKTTTATETTSTSTQSTSSPSGFSLNSLLSGNPKIYIINNLPYSVLVYNSPKNPHIGDTAKFGIGSLVAMRAHSRVLLLTPDTIFDTSTKSYNRKTNVSFDCKPLPGGKNYQVTFNQTDKGPVCQVSSLPG